MMTPRADLAAAFRRLEDDYVALADELADLRRRVKNEIARVGSERKAKIDAFRAAFCRLLELDEVIDSELSGIGFLVEDFGDDDADDDV